MDYISQFRVMNPHQYDFLKRQRKPDHCAAISKIYTRSLYQRHIPKRGQVIKILLRSIFLNGSVLNTLHIFTDLKGPKEKYNLHHG